LDGGDVIDLRHGDCLDILPTLPDNFIDLIVTDPPYFRVKGEAWDRQWDNADAFLEWVRLLVDEWHRILRPNGSLYVFASPDMSARVECRIAERLNVLNNIRWQKEAGWHRKADKDAIRSYLSPWEAIIFAEHYGADNIAKGEAGYEAKCDQLRGFLFEPLRAYLDDERKRAGFTPDDVNEVLGFRRQGGMAGRHYFSRSQWCLPTEEHYEKMRGAFNSKGDEYLRRDYEDLRRDYEDLRRYFTVSADVPYTDVWDFPTVQAYPGKHVCEKPAALIRHIIRTSSRPGAVVLDCFMGSGVTGEVCAEEGRDFIGCDTDALWVKRAQHRIEAAQMAARQLEFVA
jgi:adenine-specific DNA-methyltransferase